MTDTKASPLLNRIRCILPDLIQMQFYPRSGPSPQPQDRKESRRLCGIWDTGPYLGGTTPWNGALESCHEERPSAGCGVWKPRSWPGGGMSQGPRAEKDSEPWEQWWIRWDIWGQSWGFCGVSRDGLKGEMDKDRLTLCVSGMFSESCWMETNSPFLKSHSTLHYLGHCPHCLSLWFFEYAHPSPNINSLKASPSFTHLCTPFSVHTQSLAQCLAYNHSNKYLFDGLWKHYPLWFPIGSNKTWSKIL